MLIPFPVYPCHIDIRLCTQGRWWLATLSYEKIKQNELHYWFLNPVCKQFLVKNG